MGGGSWLRYISGKDDFLRNSPAAPIGDGETMQPAPEKPNVGVDSSNDAEKTSSGEAKSEEAVELAAMLERLRQRFQKDSK